MRASAATVFGLREKLSKQPERLGYWLQIVQAGGKKGLSRVEKRTKVELLRLRKTFCIPFASSGGRARAVKKIEKKRDSFLINVSITIR
ncbi:hypothetical protein [Rhizobium tumorigenes]|uniref:Uncharacterized protein n=1 Tax=Rhizobium tumorigenes TaxID=2041385 RepID=A0AAF1KRW2_9HYPH|nr:hypothetical protein [Rhizobium tumorigenes]WFR97152.1 hypothetical protein PR017_08645 [Rhizobium tumorigenes]